MAYGGADSIAIKKNTITLTDAQIKALPTTDVEILPLSGAGKINVWLGVLCDSRKAGGVYTNYDIDTTLRIMGMPELEVTGADGADFFSNIIGAGSNSLAWIASGDIFTFKELSIYENNVIKLDFVNAGGDLTGGHVDNILKITTFYVVVDV